MLLTLFLSNHLLLSHDYPSLSSNFWHRGKATTYSIPYICVTIPSMWDFTDKCISWISVKNYMIMCKRNHPVPWGYLLQPFCTSSIFLTICLNVAFDMQSLYICEWYVICLKYIKSGKDLNHSPHLAVLIMYIAS